MAGSAAPVRRAARARAIAGACAAAGALALAAVAIGLARGEDPTEAARLAARYSARVSFLLFLPVYVASAWHRLARSAASRFVVEQRRALGLAFATAHTVHLGALVAFQVLAAERPDLPTVVVGGGAYLAMFAMAATSHDAALRRLGRRWRTLHRIGLHWLWFVFAFSYTGRLAAGQPFFAPFAALAFAGLAARVAAWRSARRRAQSPAPAPAEARAARSSASR
jgi:DMSO/TMAO reductase YedYZ heme-binding membrane subunit